MSGFLHVSSLEVLLYLEEVFLFSMLKSLDQLHVCPTGPTETLLYMKLKS